MMSIRRLPWLLLTGACAMASVAACSESDDRETFDGKTDSGAAALPDAAAEASPGDAGVDAKPPFDPADEPVVCAGSPCVVQLVAGENHFCARMNDGTVRCWGDSANGALGHDASDLPDSPDAGANAFIVGAVTGVADAKMLSAGGTTTCALGADGTVRCWGGNDAGQLGISVSPPTADEDSHPLPSTTALPRAAKRIDVGPRSACAVLSNDGSDETWCWGDNAQRLLARSSPVDVGGPAKADFGPLAVTRTVAGTNTGFGFTSTGEVVSWGGVAGAEGVVAARIAALSPDVSPLSIKLTSVTSLSTSSTTFIPQYGWPQPPPLGIAHACAIAAGEVHCWGSSPMGALGTGLPEPTVKPTHANVASEKAWPQQVVAAGDITCVRLTDGTVQCAGDNVHGALGKDPESAYSMFLEPVPSFEEHAVQIAATSGSVCALVQGGHVVCWGSNAHGELATGTVDEDAHSKPLSVRF